MKKILMVCCMGLLLCSCAEDKHYAPQEGRISLFQDDDIPFTSKAIKVDATETQIGMLLNYAETENNLPHIQAQKSDSWVAKGPHERLENAPTLPQPVVNKKSVFTLDGQFQLNKFDRKTGKSDWNKVLQAGQVGISLIQANKNLFALSQQGVLIATDLDGKILWEKDFKTPFRNQLMADKEQIYLLSATNDLWALNVQDGTEVWHYKTQTPKTSLYQMANVAVHRDTLVVPFTNGEIIAFNKKTGTFLWSYDMNASKSFSQIDRIAQMTASPVIHNNTVYLMGHTNKLTAIDLKTGKEKWTLNFGGDITPIANGNILYVWTNQQKVMALDNETGRLFWQQQMPTSARAKGIHLISNQLAVANDTQIQFLDMKSGQKIRTLSMDMNGSTIAWVSSGIYLLQNNGKLVHQGSVQ